MRLGLAWGPTGAAALAPAYGVAVVVDVLSFSTTVTVAADLGTRVVPHRWADASAARAAEQRDAVLAVGRRAAGPGQVSLSPSSFRSAEPVRRVVLPSPNGSTICAVLAEEGTDVVVASLRNRTAVAHRLAGRDVLLVPAGERWPDGSLRPAVEDLWGVGALVAALLEADPAWDTDDEALAAAAAYRLVEHRLAEALSACPSGRELVEAGYASDVTIAAELDASTCVPQLVDGVLVS